MKKLPRKILVVVLDNLGDAVMASAILKPLKRLFPQAFIGVWVKQYAKGLFTDHSLVDAVHAADPFWDKSPGLGRGSLADFTRVVFEVRRVRYDVAFVLNAEWRRALACSTARVTERVGYDRRESATFLTSAFPPPRAGQHFVDDHRQLVEMWTKHGVALDDCVPRLEVADEELKWWHSWSFSTGLGGRPFNALHVFSGDDRKNWPLSRWTELIDRRLALNAKEKFLVICGPGEEKKLGSFATRFAKDSVKTIVAPPLGQLKAVLKAARLFIGGDSGPGHVAAALGTPVISLFGPTRPERCRPLGNAPVRIFHEEPLSSLTVERVLAAVEEISSRV